MTSDFFIGLGVGSAITSVPFMYLLRVALLTRPGRLPPQAPPPREIRHVETFVSPEEDNLQDRIWDLQNQVEALESQVEDAQENLAEANEQRRAARQDLLHELEYHADDTLTEVSHELTRIIENTVVDLQAVVDRYRSDLEDALTFIPESEESNAVPAVVPEEVADPKSPKTAWDHRMEESD